ncbi:efflux RND transporter periplasmic adaptor subunit [Pantanalinema sp. GBBB05]|uniref:efflux RND transporter periplasmic adaptor subunit n=1 Tax=Pantanalinema sp. GBBB05 TaxID=2604139 RepID=UPI001D7782F9|nr:efflux RND transporter periplasmic adaptor subunit [Pantanalinema sp. GBBB05]
MFPSVLGKPRTVKIAGWLILAGLLPALWGCSELSRAEVETKPKSEATEEEAAAANVMVAREGTVRQAREYTGTTQPFRLVSLRSQVEGQLLNLDVTVGDSVQQGQVLARVDSTVLTTSVAEAQAEVAARESEVAQAQIGVSDARTLVNRARAELQQAQSDLKRLQYLGNQGAIPAQQAEQASTRVKTAEETLRSAQEQVRTRQEAVIAAQGRVAAQQAVVNREQERQSFASLNSPVTGSVVEQPIDPGSLVQAGTEVLKLGDFSQVKVAVQISELELGNLRLGQSVKVRLDAFPKQEFTGEVTRISPAADPVARLVPIEVTIPNPNGRIGSGLLARVTLNQTSNRSRVLVPETALEVNQPRRGGQQGGSRQSGQSDRQNQSAPGRGTLFVLEGSGNQAKVTARQVMLGNRGDGLVEVISGLRSGERFVARSSKTLKSGDIVRLSVLSEPG